jgi:hypothetical protein
LSSFCNNIVMARGLRRHARRTPARLSAPQAI